MARVWSPDLFSAMANQSNTAAPHKVLRSLPIFAKLCSNTGTASLTSTAGTHTVTTAAALASNLAVAVSANSLALNGVLSGAGSLSKSGNGLLTLGATRVRVRRAGEALAPEKPLGRVRVVQWRTIGLLALLLMLVLIGEQWLDADPGQKFSDFVMPLLGVPMMVTAWSLMWGLGSKLFQRHYVFLPHLRLALLFSLVIYAAGEFLPGLAFASGWAWPSRIESLVQTALVLALVHAHLSLVLPNLRRMFAIAVGLVFAVGLSLGAFVNLQKQHRFFGELYTATLGPPALRLAPTVSVERYLEETKTLKAALDRHANDDEEDADEGLEIDDE